MIVHGALTVERSWVGPETREDGGTETEDGVQPSRERRSTGGAVHHTGQWTTSGGLLFETQRALADRSSAKRARSMSTAEQESQMKLVGGSSSPQVSQHL